MCPFFGGGPLFFPSLSILLWCGAAFLPLPPRSLGVVLPFSTSFEWCCVSPSFFERVERGGDHEVLEVFTLP